MVAMLFGAKPKHGGLYYIRTDNTCIGSKMLSLKFKGLSQMMYYGVLYSIVHKYTGVYMYVIHTTCMYYTFMKVFAFAGLLYIHQYV